MTYPIGMELSWIPLGWHTYCLTLPKLSGVQEKLTKGCELNKAAQHDNGLVKWIIISPSRLGGREYSVDTEVTVRSKMN